MAPLIDDLLDVNRVTRGKVRLEVAPLELNAPLNTAVEFVKPAVAAHGHTLQVRIGGRSTRVHGDTTRLAQVVVNLLTNAVKYTPHGGHIEVIVDDDGEVARIKVKDTGLGMTDVLLQRAFEPFVQEVSNAQAEGGFPLKDQPQIHDKLTCLTQGMFEFSCGTKCSTDARNGVRQGCRPRRSPPRAGFFIPGHDDACIGAAMTTEELEQRLARLEWLYEDASARLMVTEGLLSSIVRHLPEAAAMVEDFKRHQAYLEAASLHSSGTTDSWNAKLQDAREVMLFRLSISADQARSAPDSKP